MASSSLSSPQSYLNRNWKHHVFPSFHGPDVRKGFLSHILKEFRSKAIDPFIDNDIERSKSIGPELIEAIRGSRIAIVLLSKNYASSTWCLDELVQIIKCREEFGQTVMVLFYEVEPTDVKKQTGDFGKVFTETCKGKSDDDIGRWKLALATVATIAGYHSKNWDNEAKMVEEIATDVSNKLNNSTLSMDFSGLIGMESHMGNMASLLQPDLKEARIIGILGPSGIGKTTIARFLFNQHSKDFPLSVFMENIRASYPIPVCSDDYGVKKYFQGQFMSQLINMEGFKIPHLGIIKDSLKDKKVFAVLDGVNRPVQLEAMAKETSWFGPGSRIIVTTQDPKLLKASGINHIYKVDFPSSDEALQMFCMYAFGQKSPKDGFEELAWQVTSLAGQLPLGLRVLGSYFRGMSNQVDWEKALPRLKTRIDGEIESILKFSYDELHDEDKNLFLHIACFFHFEQNSEVESCLANSLLISDVTHGLDVLTEKSLIYFDRGRVRMHTLLIQLGREIVRKQSINEPGKRQFLVDARDIDEVHNDDKADSSNVIGINIRISFRNKEDRAFTSEGALERFYNLQFLNIEGADVNLRSLNSMSRKLRHLSWNNFPLPCFPSDFQPKFLVKLFMRNSKLEKLWEETQPLSNLKWMDLNYSERLKELPDLSTATNLCELNLTSCSSLVELPSIGNAIHLRELDLAYCRSLVKLHSSVGNVIHLKKLDLQYCSSLEQLPSSIGNLIYLEELDLHRCSSLVELPCSIGNLINLQKLCLGECNSLVKLPSSMKNLCRLSDWRIWGCSKLEVCLTNINLESLKELNLSGCSLLNIEDLKPSGTAIKEVSMSMMRSWSSNESQELGSWIGRISCLRRLELSQMQNLVSLPQLPYSIEELNVSDCESLERLECSFRNPDICLKFTRCYKLNQEARDLIIHTRTNKYAILPGEEVPACFTYRASGSSLIVKLSHNFLPTSAQFRACVILVGEEEYQPEEYESRYYEEEVYESRRYNYEALEVYCSITSEHNVFTDCISKSQPLYAKLQKHMYIFEVVATEVTTTELDFEFLLRSSKETWRGVKEYVSNKTWEIKECGVFQLY